MGATGIYAIPADKRAYLRSEIERGGQHEVLKDAMVGSCYYAAVKHLAPERGGHIFGVACPTSISGRGYDRQFIYKMMDESVGPVESACPIGILDLLSPLDDASDSSGWQRNWRQRCRERHEAKRKAPKLTEGETLYLAEPVKFQGGTSCRQFTVAKLQRRGKSVTVFRMPNGMLCRLRPEDKLALMTREQFDAHEKAKAEAASADARNAVVENFMEIAA
jgi:hypothetical protein